MVGAPGSERLRSSRRRSWPTNSTTQPSRPGAQEGEPIRRSAVGAGAVAGLAGLAVFLVLHHAWIVPIWFIAPVGAVMAAVGGAAVGAAYVELEPGLPRRPWRSAAVAMTFGGILLPAVVIAQVVGPVFAMASDGGGTLLIPESELFVVVLVGLIGVTAVAGAAVGFLVGRTRRAAALTMLAGVALAIGPGHNIPLLGGSAVVPKELAILAVVIAVASVVLVTLDAELSRRRTPRLRVSRPE